jgi:outer membrane receptor protein involved in Fe transport
VDGAIYYKWFQQDKLRSRLSLNFNNLTDRRYYEGVRGRLGIVPGAPRSLTAGLQVVF